MAGEMYQSSAAWELFQEYLMPEENPVPEKSEAVSSASYVLASSLAFTTVQSASLARALV